MSSWPYFVFPIVLIVGLEFYNEKPFPLYRNGNITIFSSRVTEFINNKIYEKCDISNYTFLIDSENHKNARDRYIFTGTFLVKEDNSKSGKFRVEELHTGILTLEKMECPGKNGKWVKFYNENYGREKASIDLKNE